MAGISQFTSSLIHHPDTTSMVPKTLLILTFLQGTQGNHQPSFPNELYCLVSISGVHHHPTETLAYALHEK
jgi:hypothetical protein